MSRPTGDADVVDNAGSHRYEITDDGGLAGFIDYTLSGDRLTLVHTEVLDGHEGRGLAGRLAKAALDDAAERDLAVDAQCPYVASYIDKHPEYHHLVGTGTDQP